MLTYDEYLNHHARNVLPVEEAISIYNDMLASFNACRVEDKDEYLESFLEKAIKYSQIRAKWELYSNEEKAEKDPNRTSTHDGVIIAANVLSRLIASDGTDAGWRERLGDNRKRVGDYACFVAYMMGVSNR